MRKNLIFLAVNTILLAVIALNSVLSLRLLQDQEHEHRLRNEAEHICLLEAVQTPIENRGADWLQTYEDCVFTISGKIKPPLKLP